MPRGRTPREAAILRRAVSSCIETLEPRRMLTTLQGGDTFDYLDADKNVIRIQLTGDIVAEFIAMRIRETNNTQVVRDLVPAPPDPDDFDTVDGANLFHVYVADASPDAQIIITQMSDDRETINPFAGSVGAIQVNDSEGGDRIRVTPGGGGLVYIGARTTDIDTIDGDDEADLPITYTSRRGDYGFRPGSRGIFAGIETAPGVSLDKILIGGTVTGRVYVGGALGTLYAGDLLLGDTIGLFGTDTPLLPNNLFIGGDFRNLLVAGDIGTAGEGVTAGKYSYRTGADIRVGGQMGNVQVAGDFLASIEVINSPDFSGNLKPITPFTEVEYVLVGDESAGDAFLDGNISLAAFSNDALTSRQYGSSHGSTITGFQQSLDFTGQLDTENGDNIDFYSLPLIAGQTVTLRLDSLGFTNLGVYDPLGRVVASDLSEGTNSTSGQFFQITADLPGTYQLAVVTAGDTSFAGDIASEIGLAPYTLSISEYGNVGLGGARIGGDSLLVEQGMGVSVRTGDLGAWNSAGAILASFMSPYTVLRGNFRALEGASIGDADSELAPDLIVPRGTVGNVLSAGLLNINQSSVSVDQPIPGYAVGFDYQRVEAGGDMIGNLVANRAIGTVVAAEIPGAPLFIANADNRGEDGRIDLIDVTGDFGSALTGGPGLFTGLGGNVKYVRVGGTVYRDFFFGLILNTDVTVPTGRSITLTDDSGANAIFAPTNVVTTTTGTGGTTTSTVRGQLTLTPYGVRESGGVVLINIESTTSMNVSVTNSVGQFDIADMIVSGTGTAVVYNATTDIVQFTPVAAPGTGTGTGTSTVVTRTPARSNAVMLSGGVPINVLSMQGANLTNVTNQTSGEIAGIDADTVGFLQANSLGYVKSSTASLVLPNTNIPTNTFPFNDYSYGLNIAGPVIQILSREAVGTVNIAGAVGTIVANSDAKNNGAIFEGINGPVVAEVMQLVRIGEGISYGGSGEVVKGGLFAIGGTANIQQVVGNDADIRGYVVSEGTIEDINLQNGSLINAFIGTPTEIAQASPLRDTGFEVVDTQTDPTLPTTPTTPTTPTGTAYIPQYSLGTLRLNGNGGIMGSLILAGDFNAIDVRGGFGIISSSILTAAQFNPNNVVATDGLGIRNTTISAGLSLNRVHARGDGARLDVNQYRPTVLQSSSKRRYDAFTGRALTIGNDLHKFLGTSKSVSSISGVTNSGIIEDVNVNGALNLGSMEAFLIRDNVLNALSPTSSAFPMRVAFANSIGKIKATSAIMGLQVRTGRLNELNAGGNIEDANIRTSGKINTIASGRNIRGSATIEARGPEGAIDFLYAKLGLYGSVTTTSDIKKLQVRSLGNTTQALGKINELTVTGNVLTGTYVRASKGIGTLFVGGDVQTGATISAKSYGSTTILGENNGSVVVA